MRRVVPMMLIVACMAAGCLAGGARANTVECGANSVSYAEVAPPRRGKPRRGPIEVVPDALCADLVEDRPQAIESLQITLDPRTSSSRRPPSSPD
jgi:hypothetical protein